jgi:hypothetical protein
MLTATRYHPQGRVLNSLQNKELRANFCPRRRQDGIAIAPTKPMADRVFPWDMSSAGWRSMGSRTSASQSPLVGEGTHVF